MSDFPMTWIDYALTMVGVAITAGCNLAILAWALEKIL